MVSNALTGSIKLEGCVAGSRYRAAIQRASRSAASSMRSMRAVEAGAEITLARRAEGGAGRQADIRLVDDPECCAGRLGDAVYLEEEIEGSLGRCGRDAAGGDQPLDQQVAAFAGLRDLFGEKRVALLQRRHAAALQELRHAGRRILHQILEHLLQRGMDLQPAHTPAGHGPVLGESVDVDDAVFGLGNIEEGGRALAAVAETGHRSRRR